MRDDFERAIAFVIKHEGGYVNNPNYTGGETNYGISKRAYPAQDIKNLTEADAKAIYKKDYWEKCDCDALPWPMNLAVLDAAVNCGPRRAMNWLHISTDWLDYINHRRDFYKALNKPVFLKGWINRLSDLERVALRVVDAPDDADEAKCR